jgi:uncharacterized DUF497 family protein
LHYRFDWDPAKEAQNVRKHGVGFRRAATIFRDPNQLSIYDEAHSDVEDRWVTIGLDRTDVLRVVVHTFEHVGEGQFEIRFISARKATAREIDQYQDRRI